MGTQCSYCEKSIPYWNIIFEKHKYRTNILAISLNENEVTKKWMNKHQLKFNVYSSFNDNVRDLYKINGIPQTIFTDGFGNVKNVWLGELNSSIVDEIENFIAEKKSNNVN